MSVAYIITRGDIKEKFFLALLAICVRTGDMLDCFPMQTIFSLLPYIQIILSGLLVATILIQASEAGLSGTFGGDNLGGVRHTRRGFERTLFIATIVIAILFVITSFLALAGNRV